MECYHRFEKEFSPNQNKTNTGGSFQPNNNNPTPSAFMTNQNSNPFVYALQIVTNLNWYADSGVSNHVSGDYHNIGKPTEYRGNERGNSR